MCCRLPRPQGLCLVLVVCFVLLIPASPATAVPVELQVLLDLDEDSTTGCDLPTVAGVFEGIEQILLVDMETGGDGTAMVTGTRARECVNPAINAFGPPVLVSLGGWEVGIGLGVGGSHVVEAEVPADLLLDGEPRARLGLFFDGGRGGDALITTAPGGDDPIIVEIEEAVMEIPTAGPGGLILLTGLLAALALVVLRRQAVLGLLAACLLLGGGVVGAVCMSDGDPTDWGALAPLANDATGDGFAGVDLRALFARFDDGGLCLRIDTVLPFNQAPMADPQMVATDEDTPLAITLTGSDPDSDPLTYSIVTASASGSLSGTPPAVTYTPDANFQGADAFTFQVDDGQGGTDTAVVDVTVNPVDDVPVAVDDTATVAEDAAATALPVLANDTDVDGGAISISAVTQPTNGTVVITGGGTGLTYQPAADYCNDPPGTTPDTFTYTLTPGGSGATVSVTVPCGDDAPVAVNDAATVAEDAPATAVPVLANDTDTDGGPKLIASVTQPTNGTVVITGGGTGLTYQPAADYCNDPPGTAPDTFTYTLTPGGSVATVSMTVACADDAPVAVNDSATLTEDDPATAVPVLTNDTDLDGGPISISAVTQPANGAVVITGGGTGLTYQPAADYCNDPPGTTLDTFTYTLTPGGSVATVSMTVTCVDDAPVAVNDSATVTEDDPATAVPVLTNDTDLDGGPISISAVTQPANGAVVITGGGTGLTYQPNANNCNSPPGTTLDTFTYTLTPGGSVATVSMTVTCVDDAPVAVNDSATVTEDDPATAVPVLANDTDIDGGPISISAVTQPANGTVVITGGGTGLTYQPNANNCNSPPGTTLDTFTYTLTPGGSVATVSMTVTCVDDAPVGVNDSATVTEDDPATAVPVLANDTDIDGGPISISAVTQPANGAVVITGGGTGLTYQPNANYCNSPPGTTPDTFTYTLTPGGSVATVSMTVTCVDDAPVAVNDAATVTEDDPATAVPVLANDTDIDGGPISISAVTQPANGTVVITGGGTGLTYQPNANYCNSPPGTTPDTFTYTLTPGSSSATVSMTVTCVDDAPVAVNDGATVDEDSGANAINVLANDTDVDGGPISISAVTQPTNGTVVITGGGTGLTYEPALNYCNNPPGTTPDTFSYTLTPGGSVAGVSVLVNCINDPPVAGADAFETIGNTQLVVDLAALATPHVLAVTGSTFGVLDNDADPVEGSPVTVVGIVGCGDLTAPFGDSPACTTSNGGEVVMEANGRFTFTPAAGDGTADSFQYQLSDGTDTVAGMVDLTLQAMVWYVDNAAASGGDGTSATSFDSLTPLNGASGAGDADGVGHYLFVHFGDGTSGGLDGGLEIEAGQHLIGEHVGLSLPLGLNGNAPPTLLVAAAPGDRPLVENLAAGASAVFAADLIPAEIAGLSLAATVNAIDWTTNLAFAGSGSFAIHDNVVRSAGAEGVDLNLGGTGTVTVAFMNNGLTATGNAFDARTTAGALRLAFSGNTNLLSGASGAVIDGSGGGTVTLTGFANNSVHPNTAGTGISVSNATFDAVPGGAFDTVSGGATVVGASGNGVGASALLLNTVSGDLSFTDLDLFADGGTALRLAGTGTFTGATGTRVVVGAGVAIFSAAGGPAADLASATVTLSLSTLTSTNSSTTGVSLSNLAGTFSAGAGSTITNATGTDFAISGGTVASTYAGTITDDLGILVSVAGTTGGAKVWSGAITDGNDGDGSGISITNNSNSPISFTGGLTLSTGANPAFTATTNNAGALASLTITGTNQITTTTGTALNVTNSIIGAGGLNFRSISAGTGASGPASGIVLNNTGTVGGLTVTGTGGAGTGGTIQRATGDGISLNNTRLISLTSMVIQNNLGSGIFGDDVSDFSLIGSSVLNNADTTGGTEAGLRFQELLGNCAITNSTISGSVEDNIRLTPASGVLSNLAISGTTIGPNNPATGGSGLAIVGTGTAEVTVNLTGSTITTNRASGILTSFADTARHTVNISTTAFANNNTAIDLGTDFSADMSFNISNNSSILGSAANAINIISGANATNAAQLRGIIDGNTIGSGAPDSGSMNAFGIAADLRGDIDAVLSITNNTVRNTDIEGIFVQSRLDNDADAEIGLVDLTVRDNTVFTPDDNSAFPFGFVYGTRIESRNTSNFCLDIAGNTSAGVGGAEHFRTRQRDTSTFRVERLALGAQTAATMQTFVAAQNDAGSTASATVATSYTGVADGTCRTP